MNTTTNGIPYDADKNNSSVILFPSKESHSLADLRDAKKELKAAGKKPFVTWTRSINNN